MPTLNDRARFATDRDLRHSLIAALYNAAVNVMAEPGSTEHHDVRAQLARSILIGLPTEYVERFAWAASTNNVVVDKWASNDREGALNDLDYVISTVWNPMAGITEPGS